MRSAGFRTRLLASLVTVASMLNLSSASIAQTYPSRGVKLVVPLAPGVGGAGGGGGASAPAAPRRLRVLAAPLLLRVLPAPATTYRELS